MLLIQGAYKRQKADRTGSGFGNGTAGHIRFIYDTGFRCCQQIVDSFIESGLHPLKTSLLERAAKTLKRAMFISRFLPPDRSNRMASPWIRVNKSGIIYSLFCLGFHTKPPEKTGVRFCIEGIFSPFPLQLEYGSRPRGTFSFKIHNSFFLLNIKIQCFSKRYSTSISFR